MEAKHLLSAQSYSPTDSLLNKHEQFVLQLMSDSSACGVSANNTPNFSMAPWGPRNCT